MIDSDNPPTYARLTADYKPVGVIFPKGRVVKILRRVGYADKHYLFEVEVVTQACASIAGHDPPARLQTLFITANKLQLLSALEQLASAAEGTDAEPGRNSQNHLSRR